MLNEYGISSEAIGQNLGSEGVTRPNHLEDFFVGTAKSANYGSNFKSCKNGQKDSPLRLCGGAPDLDECGKPRASITANHFNKVLSAYQKAIDPRWQKPSCKNGAPSYSLKLYDASDDSLDGAKSACGTSGCPSGKLANRPDKFSKSQSQKSCGLSGCPFVISQTESKTEKVPELEALARSATKIKPGAKCSSNFLPAVPPLKIIHWDCPDPLPDGPCQNPLCPLKPRECRDIPPPAGSCGTVKCPYAVPVICGEKCPNNLPKTIAYSPPPPPCRFPHPSHPPIFSPPPPSCRNPRCPFSPPPPTCANPQCPFSSPKPPSCASPRCPHSPRPPSGPQQRCPFSH